MKMEMTVSRFSTFFHRVYDLYYSGFAGMTVGKKLWRIILIKLFIIFVVLRFFFYTQSSFYRYTETEKIQTIQHMLGESPGRKP
jgi:uncharacterized membrane protein